MAGDTDSAMANIVSMASDKKAAADAKRKISDADSDPTGLNRPSNGDSGTNEPDGDIVPPKKKKGGRVHGEMPKKRLDKKARGGSIHIKPSHKGLFTKKAKAAGKTVSEYAEEKKDAGGVLGKEANFAVNAKKFKH